MNNRRITGWIGRTSAAVSLCAAGLGLSGCAQIHNQWVEDGPAVQETWETPTSQDLIQKFPPAEQRHRAGEPMELSAESGAVVHGPLYMEDPFVDKGHGRTGMNVHHLGWEDCIAMPYCLARYTLNWLLSPASLVVTPPWTKMESDGEISKQILWYDHDAARAGSAQAKPSCTPPTEPPETPAAAQPEPAAPAPAESAQS